MDEFLKMDIFFFVATAAVVIVAAFVALALYRIVRILRNVEKISAIVEEEGELMRADIADLRSSVKREGFKLRSLGRFFTSIFGRVKSRTEKQD